MAEKMTKSEFIGAVVEKTGLAKKDVNSVFEAVHAIVSEQLGKGGPGEVVLPNLLKLTVTTKPAVPERQGINPFTKQPTTFKAKPERRIVKARMLKSLKDAISGEEAQKDDLAIIEGIGPVIAKAFNKAGIVTFKNLADAPVSKLEEILHAAGLPGTPHTWPQQAKLAAEGKMDELKKLQDQLVAGR